MLTLRILAHELEPLGVVYLNDRDAALHLQDARLPSKAPLHIDTLYITDASQKTEEVIPPEYTTLHICREEETIPHGASLTLFTSKDKTTVLSMVNDIFTAYGDWERQMDRILLESQDLQELCNISSKMLKNNVVIVDPALKLLAYTRDVSCDDPITIELIKHGYHTDANIKQFKLHKRFEPWTTQRGFIINDTHQICKYTTVARSFKTKNSFSLIVIMMCNVEMPSDYLLDVFAMMLNRVRYFAEKEYPDDKPSGNTVDTFLRDLIEKRITKEQFILERSKFAGVPYKGPFCLFCIEVGTKPNYPVARLLSEIAQKVAPAKTIFYQDIIVVLCFSCRHTACSQKCVTKKCSLKQPTITNRIEAVLETYDIYCGRSSTFDSLAETHRAFLQAKEIIPIGIQQKRNSDNADALKSSRIFAFDTHYMKYLIKKAEINGEDIVRSAAGCKTLEKIKKYDDEHNTDNYYFLYHYLRCERRASLAAQQLHMHRNNVKYRIDKIETTFTVDTNDTDVRTELLLAYAILGI